MPFQVTTKQLKPGNIMPYWEVLHPKYLETTAHHFSYTKQLIILHFHKETNQEFQTEHFKHKIQTLSFVFGELNRF